MSKLIIIFLAVVFGFSQIPKVNAQNTILNPNKTTRPILNSTRSAENQEKRLDKIKEHAKRLIENRISSLNNLLQRINNNSKLSTEEKTLLSSQVQAEIDALNLLKAKIEADTDIETARQNTRKIITDHYIYRVFIPKIQLLITIDNLQALSVKLSETTVKIQELIDRIGDEGKDTTLLQSLLDDANSQLSSINTTLTNAKAKVMAINATNFQRQFAQIKQDLASVRNSFAKIKNDIGQMRTNFRGLNKSTP